MQIKVSDMTCAHCTLSIETAVRRLDAAADVTCDLDRKVVTITSNREPTCFVEAICDIGFLAEALTP